MPSLEYTDFINFDFPFVEESHDEGIYNCSAEHSAMTVVSGAKCSDGIVLIADRKLTKQNYKPDFKDKIFGDIKHYLIGYTGEFVRHFPPLYSGRYNDRKGH